MPAVQKDFEAIAREGAHTTGQRLYLEHGLEGIRGELSRGLPAVAQIGCPPCAIAWRQETAWSRRESRCSWR